MNEMTEFEGFQKIPRYSRDCIVSEKIDGTNAQILITEDGALMVGSRTRWINLESDNHGFARWIFSHGDELVHGLGPGRHYGEWWGQGIQRGYGLKEKRFSLFNVIRWNWEMFEQFKLKPWIERVNDKTRGAEPVFTEPPKCCSVVPVLTTGMFDGINLIVLMDSLKVFGSLAAPGFMDPEGIIIYHTAGNILFKKTFKNDDGKGGDR